MKVTRELRRILVITGLILILLGVVSLARGTGSGGVATLDSDTRFAGGVLVGYGTLWLHAGRTERLHAALVRILAAGLLLGGLARLLSLLAVGIPGALTLTQTAVEVVVSTLVLALLPRAVPRDADDLPV